MVNHPNRKLTPSLRDMLNRIGRASSDDGALLTLSIVSAGGREITKLRTLIAYEWVEVCDHPTVRQSQDVPAQAVRITDAGRAALAQQ